MKPSFPTLRALRAPRPLLSASGLLLLGLSVAPTVAHAQPVTFAPKTDYTAGNSLYSVESADFNGDGKLDLAAANYDDSTVSVFFGNGNGTFGAKTDYATGSGASYAGAADFNGDGKPDLVCANYNDSTVSVLINKGNGTFAAKVDYATGGNPSYVESADFNGDGKLDLVSANYGESTVSLLLGNGNGTFGAKTDYVTGGSPYSVESADFNGDGKLDLAVPSLDNDTVGVLLGNGNGTFGAKTDYAVGDIPYYTTSADFNGDGKPDLAVANYGDSTVSVLLNNGNGTFAAKVDYNSDGGAYPLTSADFNGDGKIDLAVSNYNASTTSIFTGFGDGTFGAKTDYDTGDRPYYVKAADFNGDGKTDLAVANYGDSNVSVLLNTTEQPVNFGVSISPKSPATNSVLSATPVIANGAGVSYSYLWFIGETIKQVGPSNTFDLGVAGNGDKGQSVGVAVFATRGNDTGQATNSVTVANSAPFAFSQSGTAQGGVAKTFVLRGADLDGEALTYKRVGGPSNGTATLVNNADGSATLTYTARANFGGAEAIRFVSIDESGRPSQPATLSINVTRAAPAPIPNRAPSANNVTASTRSGVLVKVALSGSDPDGDALTFKRVGGPRNGTGEIARDSDGVFKMFYTPRAGFVGNEVIQFVALDTAGKPSPVATMIINVSGSSASSALQSAPSGGNS